MATNLSIQRSLSRSSLLLVSLLTLVGILSGCGASSTAVPSHPTGSTPTSTPTKELKGTINEFPLPTPDTRHLPGDVGTERSFGVPDSGAAAGATTKVGQAFTWLLDLPRYSVGTGYIQFFTVVLYMIGLYLTPRSTKA